jgi:hypothetical protein
MHWISSFNERVAVRTTLIFGSMWATYAFFLYGFIPIVWPSAMTTLLYWSNTVQLWSLPLLMVGQNVLGRAAVRQAAETHDAVMQELELLRAERDQLGNLTAALIPAPAPKEV